MDKPKRVYKHPLVTARIDTGLLMQFDAMVAATRPKKSRTEVIELLMRQFVNGDGKLPKPLGYDAITGEAIWKREVK